MTVHHQEQQLDYIKPGQECQDPVEYRHPFSRPIKAAGGLIRVRYLLLVHLRS